MKFFIGFLNYCLLLTIYCLLFSCSNPIPENTNQPETANKKPETSLPPTPSFNEDSAYSFVKAQVDFGPRIPGTAAHAKCADYLSAKLKSYRWEVQIQNGSITTYDGKKFNLKNIIASFKPEIANRILLISHWDARPFADSDTADADKPFDSADDGPSGVGVILEIVRQFSISKPDLGIDILFDDLEDWGKNDDGGDNTWCLGTQYWAKNPHQPGYVAQYGIVFDMVGAKGATFPQEGLSREYAPYIVKKIWNKAAHLGYSNYFIFDTASSITDDHFYINNFANIPCIDIVNMNPPAKFGAHHHTHSDNMNIIDKNTLKAVGQTVLEILWEEQHPL